MLATNRTITSREYKLMLNPLCFRDRVQNSTEFWLLIEFLAGQAGATIVAVQDEEDVRTTWYLDTPENALRRLGCGLRVREEGKTKVTLKFRDSDRYLSGGRNVGAPNGKEKFEEDVLPKLSQFARSCSVEFEKTPALDTVADAIGLFPGLAELQLVKESPLRLVSESKIGEIMRKIGQFSFDDGPKVKACLNFWYPPLNHVNVITPLVAEFSFDYDLPKSDKDGGDALEQFPLTTVVGARRLFQAVQQRSAWIDFSGTTKTNLVYGEA